MIPKSNYKVYEVCVYKAGDTEAILHDRIYIPENVEKYRIPHEIASYVELKLQADMLTGEERKQTKQEEKAAYNKGLTDAWEAARKLICGYSLRQTRKILQNTEISRASDVFNNHTPTEAIAKIKAYEDKQQKIEQEIKVGDEVIENDDINKRGVVTNIKLTGSGNVYNVMWDDGRSCGYYKKEIKKTGRHFPQVEELLKAIKERSENNNEIFNESEWTQMYPCGKN